MNQLEALQPILGYLQLGMKLWIQPNKFARYDELEDAYDEA